jgi:hypothetical protein
MRIPANADSDSDRLRTAIPIDRGQRSGDRGQRLPSTALRAHSAVSVSSFPRLAVFSGGLRRVSPSRARRCAVWTRRSRTASAILVPVIDGELTGHNRRAAAVAIVDDFEQVAALL